MRIEWRLFGSRVARRVFVSLVVASAAPLVAVAVLVVTEVGGTLERRAFASLEAESRGYGQELLDRLTWMSDALATTAPDRTALDATPVTGFTTVFTESRADVTVADLPPTEAKPALLVRRNGTELRAVLVRSVGPDKVAVGNLDSAYLWRDPALREEMQVCVLVRSTPRPLFCSAPLSDGLQQEVMARWDGAPSGTLEWPDEDGARLTSYWELFVSSVFTSEPWLIVVTQPRATALSSLTAFNQVFPRALLLSFAAVLLLAMSQVRRILDPLERLVRGTKLLGQGDFRARVDVAGNDEFGALGDAMNAMADRLGRQFGTLTTLAEIDRMILASQDVETVLQASLVRMQSLVPGTAVSILLLDTADPGRGKLYWAPTQDGFRPRSTNVEIDAGNTGHPWPPLESARVGAEDLARLGMDADRCGSGGFVAPIIRDSACAGAVIATFAEMPAGDASDYSALTELAGRLAVAIAAAERERELFMRAHFDVLTGLPNRQLCEDRLRQALALARRDSNKVAVLFIDLDGFKNVNDSLGHAAGDSLLRETARRLTAALRETDTVARLGGDEYVVILPHVHDLLEVETVIEGLMAQVQRPFLTNGREAFVSASVGVTIFPEDGQSAEELLRRADTAMYTAKDVGRARAVFFSQEMDQRVHDRLGLYTDLRNAVASGELFVVYQPQVELPSGRIVSAEALLRWQHPTRGLVPPDVFVPILEETGLIETVGSWVLETALADLALMRERGAAIDRVAVNVTARQLFSRGFVEQVIGAVTAAGLQPTHLELELTESTLVTDFAASNAVLARLAAAGVRVAVDDFGTGYSSLGYLKDLTFDTLKVDRAFVANLPDEKALAIVKAVVAVAHALGKDVVAEGVESEEQSALLTGLGCALAQGYLFSRPIGRDELVRFMIERGQPRAELAHQR